MTDSSTSSRHRRSYRRFCCCGCLAPLAILAVPLYLLFSPPQPPPPLAPPERARVDASVAVKRKQIDRISRHTRSAAASPFTLVLREEEINRMLETDERALAAMRKHGVERAWVRLETGRVRISAVRAGGTGPSALTASVLPRIDSGGRITFQIEGVDIGQLGIPAVGAIRTITRRALSLLNDKSILPDAHFSSVSVGPGEITVIGKSR